MLELVKGFAMLVYYSCFKKKKYFSFFFFAYREITYSLNVLKFY